MIDTLLFVQMSLHWKGWVVPRPRRSTCIIEVDHIQMV